MADLLMAAFLQLLLSVVLLLGSYLYFLTAKWSLHLHIVPCQRCNYGGCRPAKEIKDNTGKEQIRRSVKQKACRGNEEEGDRGNEIEKLRELLRIEHQARNALTAELEKERNAAASAAEAAMEMILRLQREKASVQMESLQFRRMAEEQQIHVRQAILVLKDTVVNMEREKFALRKQLQLCSLSQADYFDLNDVDSLRLDADAEPGALGDFEVSRPANGRNDSEFRSESPKLDSKSVIVEEDEESVKTERMRLQESEEMAKGKPAELQQFLAFSSSLSSSQIDVTFFKKLPCGLHQLDASSADVGQGFSSHVCC